VIAGESGQVFGVPYDYCLRPMDESDPDCVIGAGEPLPDEGAFLLYTTAFGSTPVDPPASIDANQPLAFSLRVRAAGDTRMALIDQASLVVTFDPPQEVQVDVAANRQFLTLIPQPAFVPAGDGTLGVTIRGDYLVDPERTGLKTEGGSKGGSFDRTFAFALSETGAAALPLAIPAQPGDPQGVWELSRLAATLPTLLPSYNQIGFDSHHLLAGLVEGTASSGVAWVVEGMPTDAGPVVPRPGARGVFPVALTYDQGLLTMEAGQGVSLEIQSIALDFQAFRVSARLDAAGDAIGPAAVFARTICADIPLYGYFVRQLGLCHPDTDVLLAWGAMILEARPGAQAPEGLGTVAWEATASGVTATLTGSTIDPSEHQTGLLLIDAATGAPLTLPYGLDLERTTTEAGTLATLHLPYERAAVPDTIRAYLMVGTYPAARAELTVP